MREVDLGDLGLTTKNKSFWRARKDAGVPDNTERQGSRMS
jgi:hypothetical protein